MTEIRRLTADDLDQYRAIRLHALRTAPEAFGNTLEREQQLPIEESLDRLTTSIVLAPFDGERIVGLAGLRPESGPKQGHRGFIWGFFVDPSVRRRGLGRRLLAALLDAAPEHLEQVTLSVMATNQPAIALYEAAGFVRFGLQPRAFRESWGYVDDCHMIRMLERRSR